MRRPLKNLVFFNCASWRSHPGRSVHCVWGGGGSIPRAHGALDTTPFSIPLDREQLFPSYLMGFCLYALAWQIGVNIIDLLQMFHFIGEKMQTRRGSPKSMWLPCPSVIQMPAPKRQWGKEGVTVDMGTGLSLAGLLYLRGLASRAGG